MKTKTDICPCSSGKRYDDCCKIFHEGKALPTALQLMRSRYSAYSKCLVHYIIETTDPLGPQYCRHLSDWKRSIIEFSRSHYFEKLEIIESMEESDSASVTFTAHVSLKGGQDVSFTEKSTFSKNHGRWLYLSGTV